MFSDLKETSTNFYEKSCPSSNSLLPEKIRQPLKNFITGSCPRTSTNKRLRALDFQANNAVHLRAIYDMGITIRDIGDGKVRLFHSFYNVSIFC